ncbi:MAG: 2-hydroxyacyl-CoA dehydratase family protein [Bacillota bacterium]|uniref:2-hydroxyacyl-CoA dehydratase family protein n=1 Tax=Desulfurispora thermophila TaxID=265470 RepID=UPI00037208F9|nr:2-hydroxyacyl-CoA dehydratase family protein [Desulfurispora thermophila]
MEKIGITTTVPVEIIYAAGCVPVDLNNVFITSACPGQLVEEAELAGYPRNVCAWIKGIYSAALHMGIKKVVAVTQGDCSNTHALMETWQLAGIEIIPFAYPFDRDYDMLKLQIQKLMDFFAVDWLQVQRSWSELQEVRRLAHRIDELTWRENRVHGKDNHLYLVNCSDFNGDPGEYAERASRLIAGLPADPLAGADEVRLAYIGVPPIMDDLYDYVESRGARVVFNETQRQFSMPFQTADLVEQYRLYTYPYGIFYRLQDIQEQLALRRVQGVIHYAQSFCYRQIEDMIVRARLSLPVLTLEGDRPNKLDARTKMRLDAFIEMLRA